MLNKDGPVGSNDLLVVDNLTQVHSLAENIAYFEDCIACFLIGSKMIPFSKQARQNACIFGSVTRKQASYYDDKTSSNFGMVIFLS